MIILLFLLSPFLLKDTMRKGEWGNRERKLNFKKN
jgi:hypothetical protein